MNWEKVFEMLETMATEGGLDLAKAHHIRVELRIHRDLELDAGTQSLKPHKDHFDLKLSADGQSYHPHIALAHLKALVDQMAEE